MKVKDLIKELQKLPEDSNITVWNFFDAKDGHIAVKYYAYDEDIWEEVWSMENDIDYFFKHRDKFPKKVRFNLMPNDEHYIENVKKRKQ